MGHAHGARGYGRRRAGGGGRMRISGSAAAAGGRGPAMAGGSLSGSATPGGRDVA